MIVISVLADAVYGLFHLGGALFVVVAVLAVIAWAGAYAVSHQA